jgi:hypothetical protein
MFLQVDREVQRFNGYVFGHYDSRGGATLIRAERLLEAAEAYATDFVGGESVSDDERRMFLNNALEEDFMFRATVIVCDAPLGGAADLDGDYDESGYQYGEVTALAGDHCKALVLWRGAPPRVIFLNDGTEDSITPIELGEDAWGLRWDPALNS